MHVTTPTGARRATPPMMPPGPSAVLGMMPGSTGIISSSAMPFA